MRLSNTLAHRRLLYRRYLADLPDILIIDVPASHAAPNLPLGRYYPIMIETALEGIEIDRFLDCERPALVAPDLLDRRPSTCQGDEIRICHYDAKEEGWPSILLAQWPRAYTSLISTRTDMFARQAYTIEFFTHALDRDKATHILLASLAGQGGTPVIVLAER